jgi:hypothetical protein
VDVHTGVREPNVIGAVVVVAVVLSYFGLR